MAKLTLTKIAVLVLVAVLSYTLGVYRTQRRADVILQAQWAGETKRLEYAYSLVDSCSSDMCLGGWSELIDNVQAK